MTGFLLAGVGNVDLRRKSNFLIVNESKGISLWSCLVEAEETQVFGLTHLALPLQRQQ